MNIKAKNHQNFRFSFSLYINMYVIICDTYKNKNIAFKTKPTFRPCRKCFHLTTKSGSLSNFAWEKVITFFNEVNYFQEPKPINNRGIYNYFVS